MDQDETWHAGRSRPWPHCVRWGPSSPPPKRGGVPQFSTHVCCSQTAGWIKMALGMEVGLGRDHIALDGDPATFPKKGGRAPQFSVHFYCGQTTGCIKMPLGMEVGLSSSDFVLDGDPALLSPKIGAEPPTQFSAHFYCGQKTKRR